MTTTATANHSTGISGEPNPQALDKLLGLVVNDMGAAVNGSLVVLGDRLGIYSALAKVGPCTVEALADATELDARYLLEWLSAQAASGYVAYGDGKFWMTPEQRAVFADPDSPVALTGGFYSVAATYHDEPRVAKAFQTGGGVDYKDHHNCLFCGIERFFRPGYAANLVQKWIPALDGVEAKLRAGAAVADIGCGRGASTLIMAAAFPQSRFYGFDLHEASIHRARQLAAEQNLTNVEFHVARAKDYTGSEYDLVTTFDALHDMGDPVGAAAHVRQSLKPDGTWMIVEPMAGDSIEENLNPVGRVYFAFSTMVCTPTSKGQEVALALGAQAGEKRLRGVIGEGGFNRIRRAAETPFNMILEARP